MRNIDTYRGVEIHLVDDPSRRDRPYYISGEFWLTDDESTYATAAMLVNAANNRIEDLRCLHREFVRDDSESSCFFFNACDPEAMYVLIDILHEQDRVKAPKPYKSRRSASAIMHDLLEVIWYHEGAMDEHAERIHDLEAEAREYIAQNR
jgi:hypothetical protein